MSAREVYQKMTNIFTVDREDLISQVQNLVPDLAESSSIRSFKIAPVKSYFGDIKTLSSGDFRGIIVPSFATHWGVVVENTLYHLTFRNPDHAGIDLCDFARHGKPIKFTATVCDPGVFDNYSIIGSTKHDHETRVNIGQALIKAFRNYHRLFWNCQAFAQCFLYFITGEHSFDEYYSKASVANF